MRIALIFDQTREDTWGFYFLRAFRQLGVEIQHHWLRDADRIPAGLDLYVRVDHGSYERDLPPALTPSVFVISDTHLTKPFAAIRRQAPRYTWCSCGNRDGAQRLQQQGIPAIWLPSGCDPEIHRGPPRPADQSESRGGPRPAQYDVAAVGYEGGLARSLFLQSLRERYPRHYLDTAPYQQMREIYGSAKIGVNWGYGDFPDRNTFNMRCFEIMAAGALCLTPVVQDGSVEALGYQDRESLALFHSPQEVPALIDYYLSHDAERARLAAAGARHTLDHHTYVHRAAALLTHVTGRAWPVPEAAHVAM